MVRTLQALGGSVPPRRVVLCAPASRFLNPFGYGDLPESTRRLYFDSDSDSNSALDSDSDFVSRQLTRWIASMCRRPHEGRPGTSGMK